MASVIDSRLAAGPGVTVAGRRICLHDQQRDNADRLARRLLRSVDVRSVLYNAGEGQLTVCLRDAATASRMLGDVALVARQQQSLLRHTHGALPHHHDVLRWDDHTTGTRSYVRAPSQARGFYRVLLLLGAAFSLTLAIIAIAVPGLPTTPLLLVASFCLLRSSRRLHNRLLQSRFYGPFLREWQVYGALRPGVKPAALTTIAVVVALTLWLARLPVPASAVIAGFAVIGAGVVARLPVVER